MNPKKVVSKIIQKIERDGIKSLLIVGTLRIKTRMFRRLDKIQIDIRSPVHIKKNRKSSGFYYQMSRSEGVDERWDKLEPRLRKNTSVLDVGCNAGMLTAKLGETGRFAIGLEKNGATIADAVEYHGLSREFGLINKPITPETVHSLPTFDYIFVFSIYHVLYRHYGQDTAEELLHLLSKKATDTLFFEAASQKRKYRDSDLPFEDFDEESIVAYNIEMLESVIVNSANVEYIGSSSRKRDKRGERYLFAVKK